MHWGAFVAILVVLGATTVHIVLLNLVTNRPTRRLLIGLGGAFLATAVAT